MPDSPTPPFSTLLLTGAAGTLGRVLTPPLRGLCQQLRLSDLPGPLATWPALREGEAWPCDLADATAMNQLLHGMQAVVHLGGVSVEGPFEPIAQANLRGTTHLYEAARRAGTQRIVFASSNHVTGCYPQGQRINPQDPPRPDGFCGASKLYGKGLAYLYFESYGIESVCLCIGTATPTPPDRRALATWPSLGDLVRLVTAALTAPAVGCTVAYGMSNNPAGWWDTQAAWARLGYVPQDSAADVVAQAQHIHPPESSAMARLQGGIFLGIGPFDHTP